MRSVAAIAAACEDCGAPARVHVLQGYARGCPILRDWCLVCGQKRTDGEANTASIWPMPGATIPGLLVTAGLAIGLAGLFGDNIGITGAAGFGHYQQVGVLLGALFVVIGAAMRVDIIAVIGTLTFALATTADIFHFEGTGGFGWKQQCALLGAVGLAALGVGCRFVSDYRGGRAGN